VRTLAVAEQRVEAEGVYELVIGLTQRRDEGNLTKVCGKGFTFPLRFSEECVSGRKYGSQPEQLSVSSEEPGLVPILTSPYMYKLTVANVQLRSVST
jgi:hypothetical protein